jgi:hypothetical protein
MGRKPHRSGGSRFGLASPALTEPARHDAVIAVGRDRALVVDRGRGRLSA